MSFLSNLFKGRSTTMKEVAMELGMNYYESDEEELIHGLAGFKVFQRGRSRKVRNLLSHIDSQQGHELCIFDYSIVTGGGKNRRKKYMTIFMVRSSGMDLPLFQLKPKYFYHKIGEYIGWTKDIAFDTHPVGKKDGIWRASEMKCYFTGEMGVRRRPLFPTCLIRGSMCIVY